MAALILFGLICFTGFGGVVKGLGISQNPDVDFPIVNVSVGYEGASPEVMETDVVDPIEDAITSVEGVKQMSSTSRQGSANITVEFDISRDIDAALQDVQTRVAQAARRLPREIDPPIINKNNPEDKPDHVAVHLGDALADLHGRLRAQRDPAAAPDHRGRGRGLHRRLPRAQRARVVRRARAWRGRASPCWT